MEGTEKNQTTFRFRSTEILCSLGKETWKGRRKTGMGISEPGRWEVLS